ncbi:MAG: hypothetical protein QG621_547 [Patescibacteria group bacterium]|jgi:hypothetical protein|nr:hypothetical protein [Patescibacteria group bacterium]
MHEDPNKITYFAQTDARGKETPFGIKRRDRARHMYVIGKTGMGKSTLLENMAIQDIRNGEAMAFIDPHGSTADRLLEYVPEHRIKDVIYFAPFDMEYPVAFNVMEDVGYDKRHLVVSGLLAAFRKIWVDAWSARMEYILSNTLLALLEYEGSTLLDVNRMLINKAFRKKVVENISDPIVRSFWVEEFANYTDRYTQDATPAIQNKIGQFTSNPLIRNIVGQAKSSFDFRKVMDEKKILIMNLSKGRVGEVNATLLGSMLVTKIYLAAMSRADVSASTLANLPNFYFYVDEFQNFANQSFADILSEARKYKLNLLIAHQYVEQMEEEVRDAVFGNVGTTIAFRVGPFDAEVLETIFQPQFSQTDLVNLGFAQIYLTLMIDGVGSPPFSATTLPPFDPPPQKHVHQVIAASRTQFGKPRVEVEEAMKKWQESDPVPEAAPKPKPAYGRATGNGGGSYTPREQRPERRIESAEVVPVRESPMRESRPVREVSRREDNRSVHPRPVQELKERVAREHTYAVAPEIQAEEPRAPRQQVAEELRTSAPPAPERRVSQNDTVRDTTDKPLDKPPLEGAHSLRDALKALRPERVESREQTARPQQPRREQTLHHEHVKPAPDLKSTLNRLTQERKQEQEGPKKEEVPSISKSTPKQERQPAGLPEERLRSMLAVDDVGEAQ